MLIDGDPNLTELLFYSIKIQLSIEDLSKEIRAIHHAIHQERFVRNVESNILLANRESEN
ncbi:hypothetical protein [Desertivirga arenae]|uniref:hypothetical protein n=1 Tax=Desertivirga arenae TaxID=2810309 RepID=UPI001A973F35|nr:hypothetical protein [Pedobacter sp. SYSU D00823]